MHNRLQSNKVTIYPIFLLTAVLALLAGCGSGSSTTPSTTTSTSTAASLSLSATPTSVPTDNSTSTTVTLLALTTSNAAVPNAIVSLSADTGILSASTVSTDSTGKATFTFSSGTTNKANRTATITASAAGTTQLPVQIVGSTIAVSTSGTTIPDDGSSPVTVTFTAKDAGSSPIAGATITVSASGAGGVTLSAASGTTDASGNFAISVSGTLAGAVTLTSSAVGATATASITVSSTAATFGISQTVLGADPPILNPTAVAMQIGNSLVVQVSAPASTNVAFFTSMGTWSVSGTNYQTVAVAAGTASATLSTTIAGLANVQVWDPASTTLSDTLTVSMTAATPSKITLQASPSVVPKSVGSTTGSSTLVATVTDALSQPVGNVPVAFSIVNPTGGGETVSPVVVFTATTPTSSLSLGQARTSFTSGSLSSAQSGIQIRAQVLGTAVTTEAAGVDATPSGNDAAIVVGGTAGSVAFGSATVLTEGGGGSTYVQAMSVLVADSNGNPAPQGTVVNLSIWPIAWSTGSGCVWDADTATTGTFYNEDINENVNLDALEDGRRYYYATNVSAGAGTVNSQLDPPNSAAGTLPATVATDANGVATFNLTYGKNSAIWITSRIRASTVVQNSEAVGEITLRLAPLKKDSDPPTVCLLPPSPYKF